MSEYLRAERRFIFDGTRHRHRISRTSCSARRPAQGYNQCSQQFLDSRTRYGGAYIQDSWKVRPNLTLNLGLRWEVSMPWYDTQGKIETIVPGEQSTQFPTAPLGWVVPGDPGIPSTLAPTRYNNFGPAPRPRLFPRIQRWHAGKALRRPGQDQHSRGLRHLLHIHRRSEPVLRSRRRAVWLVLVSPVPVLLDQPW